MCVCSSSLSVSVYDDVRFLSRVRVHDVCVRERPGFSLSTHAHVSSREICARRRDKAP